MPDSRTATGTFKKGQSGNPGGRPKKPLAIKDFLEDKTEAMFMLAVDIAQDMDKKDADRLTAIRLILEYSLGKPNQTVTNTIKSMGEAFELNIVGRKDDGAED